MKKVTLIAAVVLAAMGVNAQTGFGFQVGANMSKIKSEETYPGEPKYESDYDSKFGLIAGVVAEVPITTSFMFRPELNFIQKGAEVNEVINESSGGFSLNQKTEGDVRLNFIELPLNFVYSTPAGAGQFFIGVGPSIGFGISGKYDLKSTETLDVPGSPPVVTVENQNGDVKFDGEKRSDLSPDDRDIHFKSFDFGANALAGYKFANGLYLNLGYTKGFSNLNPNQYESAKTSGFQIKLGFMLGGSNDSE